MLPKVYYSTVVKSKKEKKSESKYRVKEVRDIKQHKVKYLGLKCK